jgi:hypothetical protein
VELNARDGYARYLLHEPQPLDFPAIEEAAHDAGYTLTKLTLVVRGRAEQPQADGSGAFLRVGKTEQRIEFEGVVPWDVDVRVTGTVSGWKSGKARLAVSEATLE